jgi:hypothetical protein
VRSQPPPVPPCPPETLAPLARLGWEAQGVDASAVTREATAGGKLCLVRRFNPSSLCHEGGQVCGPAPMIEWR